MSEKHSIFITSDGETTVVPWSENGAFLRIGGEFDLSPLPQGGAYCCTRSDPFTSELPINTVASIVVGRPVWGDVMVVGRGADGDKVSVPSSLGSMIVTIGKSWRRVAKVADSLGIEITARAPASALGQATDIPDHFNPEDWA